MQNGNADNQGAAAGSPQWQQTWRSSASAKTDVVVDHNGNEVARVANATVAQLSLADLHRQAVAETK